MKYRLGAATSAAGGSELILHGRGQHFELGHHQSFELYDLLTEMFLTIR